LYPGSFGTIQQIEAIEDVLTKAFPCPPLSSVSDGFYRQAIRREWWDFGGFGSGDFRTRVSTFADYRLGLHGADLRLDFNDPPLEAALNLGHRGMIAEVTGVVEVLQISPQLLQQFLGKS
jgi:hypothetical protein